MKRIVSLIAFMLFGLVAWAQQQVDIIYLKDGSIFKGKIIERLPDGSLKVLTTIGKELTFPVDLIKQITVEGVGTETEDYGSKTAVGISIFGEGVAGVHFRYQLASELFLDADLQFSPVFLDRGGFSFSQDIEFRPRVSTGVELNYFLKRFYKERKQKVRANGLFFRINHSYGRIDDTAVAFGWVSEYFRLNRYRNSFLLNLGPGLQVNHWANDPANYIYNRPDDLVLTIHFRLQWNFHQ